MRLVRGRVFAPSHPGWLLERSRKRAPRGMAARPIGQTEPGLSAVWHFKAAGLLRRTALLGAGESHRAYWANHLARAQIYE